MSITPDPIHLGHHHRDTLAEILRHPVSHNIEWKDVISLLEEVGSVEERHDGKYAVKLGEGELFLNKPRHKDIDTQMVVDLRKLLTEAGYAEDIK